MLQRTVQRQQFHLSARQMCAEGNPTDKRAQKEFSRKRVAGKRRTQWTTERFCSSERICRRTGTGKKTKKNKRETHTREKKGLALVWAALARGVVRQMNVALTHLSALCPSLRCSCCLHASLSGHSGVESGVRGSFGRRRWRDERRRNRRQHTGIRTASMDAAAAGRQQ